MTSFEFSLRLRLPTSLTDLDEIVNRLGEGGCTDALVALGLPGYVGLDFIREADTAVAAMNSAVSDACNALPGSELVEASPDYVGLTEVAEVIGQTRQNLRKLMIRHHDRFPAPVHSGNPSLWHLAQVLEFLQERELQVPQTLLAVARSTMQINVSRQVQTLIAAR